MIYAEIICIGKNEQGEDKLNFELYNASMEMIDDFIKTKKEWMTTHEQDFDEEDKYYFISRTLPLLFLGKNNFIPITKDFFYLKS